MIDLHVHSNITDGTATPSQIIQMAKARNLTAVALTDHDTIDGLEEADREAKKLGISFIHGIEFSVDNGNGRLLHILGLDLDVQIPDFLLLYNTFKEKRQNQLFFTIESLNIIGLHLEMDQLLPFKTGKWLDRQAVAKWLVATKRVQNISKAWTRYLDKIPYQTGELLSPELAIKIIKAGHGKSFLAHYNKNIGFQGYTFSEMKQRLLELKNIGLDGMERYYPTFTTEDMVQVDYFLDLYDFIPSGGSDYHGDNRPEIEIGIGDGDFDVPDSVLSKLMR
ncbi:MAG: PHP domain-containing protein [Spirochaetaceae bacterium]